VQIPEPAGPNCPNGGTKIEAGIDTNGDAQLESSEVTSVSYVCNGATGAQGDAGATSLIKATSESPGPNCPAGGERIDTGIDSNGDGVLEPSEIKQTAFVCNGTGSQDAGVSSAGDASMVDALAGDTDGADEGMGDAFIVGCSLTVSFLPLAGASAYDVSADGTSGHFSTAASPPSNSAALTLPPGGAWNVTAIATNGSGPTMAHLNGVSIDACGGDVSLSLSGPWIAGP
jgi:hypothetical protein